MSNQIGYTNDSKSLSGMPIYNTVNKGSNNQYTKRYYSSTEAQVFFSGAEGELLPNNGLVDEVVQIQFTVQQNVMPLFGYNSYVYDEVAVGSRVVQGALSINFTSPNYLFDLLETVNGDVHNNKNRRPLWQAPFSIDVVYGKDTAIDQSGSVTSIDAQRGTLEGVSILSCSQEMNIEGEPILEHYSFIARDYVPNVSNVSVDGVSTSSSSKVEPTHEQININDIVRDAFLWRNNQHKWFIFIDTNENYNKELESIEVLLEGGFLPKNVKKKAVRQKGGGWGVKNVLFDNSSKCTIEITAKIKNNGVQSISREVEIRDKI